MNDLHIQHEILLSVVSLPVMKSTIPYPVFLFSYACNNNDLQQQNCPSPCWNLFQRALLLATGDRGNISYQINHMCCKKRKRAIKGLCSAKKACVTSIVDVHSQSLCIFNQLLNCRCYIVSYDMKALKTLCKLSTTATYLLNRCVNSILKPV